MTACNAMTSYLETALSKEGCSLSRFQILFILHFHGPMKPTEIAKQMLVTRGNMTMFLRRMVKDRLVDKQKEPGKGWPLYRVSANGEAFFESIFPGHIVRVRAAMPVLDKRNIKKLQHLADRLQSELNDNP